MLNPLDAICNTDRTDAVCVNQLKNAKQVDEGILQERPDVKIFLPFRFLFYTPEEVFEPHTYNRFLGKAEGRAAGWLAVPCHAAPNLST